MLSLPKTCSFFVIYDQKSIFSPWKLHVIYNYCTSPSLLAGGVSRGYRHFCIVLIMEFMKSYFSNEKIHIKCWLDDSIFMYYLCCLFMQDNCGHWPKGLLWKFLLPYFVDMLSVILMSLLIYIIYYIILISVFVNSVKCE